MRVGITQTSKAYMLPISKRILHNCAKKSTTMSTILSECIDKMTLRILHKECCNSVGTLMQSMRVNRYYREVK